jgi:hypothetical protein
LKLFKVTKLAVLNILILNGLSTFATSLHAMEKVYFSTSDGEKFWCDRNNLEFHWDKSGRLAEICNPISDEEADLGRIESKPHELDTNGKLFKKYVLDLIRRGEVSFKDRADAENTLRICEELGLPKAEEFICKLLKRKPRREMLKMDTMLTESRVSNTHFQTGDCPEGYVLVPGNLSYNTP